MRKRQPPHSCILTNSMQGAASARSKMDTVHAEKVSLRFASQTSEIASRWLSETTTKNVTRHHIRFQATVCRIHLPCASVSTPKHCTSQQSTYAATWLTACQATALSGWCLAMFPSQPVQATIAKLKLSRGLWELDQAKLPGNRPQHLASCPLVGQHWLALVPHLGPASLAGQPKNSKQLDY